MDALENMIKQNPEFYLSVVVVFFFGLVLAYFIVVGFIKLVESMIEIKRVVNCIQVVVLIRHR